MTEGWKTELYKLIEERIAKCEEKPNFVIMHPVDVGEIEAEMELGIVVDLENELMTGRICGCEIIQNINHQMGLAVLVKRVGSIEKCVGRVVNLRNKLLRQYYISQEVR